MRCDHVVERLALCCRVVERLILLDDVIHIDDVVEERAQLCVHGVAIAELVSAVVVDVEDRAFPLADLGAIERPDLEPLHRRDVDECERTAAGHGRTLSPAQSVIAATRSASGSRWSRISGNPASRMAALSSTELAGRGAGRGGSRSDVAMGETRSGSCPANSNT